MYKEYRVDQEKLARKAIELRKEFVQIGKDPKDVKTLMLADSSEDATHAYMTDNNKIVLLKESHPECARMVISSTDIAEKMKALCSWYKEKIK